MWLFLFFLNKKKVKMIQTIKVDRIDEICPCALCYFEALNEKEFLHHLKFKHQLTLKDGSPFIRRQSSTQQQQQSQRNGKTH